MIPYFLNEYYSKFINPYLYKKRKPINKRKRAIKALKRDFGFSYDKKNEQYKYKKIKIDKEKAIKFVKENGITKLKKELIEE